uniref:Amidase domain-containing protein n=1 Tax=Globodera rostochiensis TaxID=31243 RepID=A0A914HNA1_GLORO
MGSKLLVAINRDGMSLYALESKQHICTYGFEQICQWQPANTYFHITMDKGNRLLFETTLGHKMDDLLTTYIQALIARRDNATKCHNINAKSENGTYTPPLRRYSQIVNIRERTIEILVDLGFSIGPQLRKNALQIFNAKIEGDDGTFCYKNGQISCNGFNGAKPEPNIYQSVAMRRYEFIRTFYPVLRFIANAYFLLVDAVFELYNAFQPVEQVGWSTANPLLFIPANKAAALIRHGKLKSFDLIDAYIARVKETALKEAAAVDKHIGQLDKTEREKPLYGVPFTSKDNLWVKGFVTVDGNKWRKQYGTPAERDAKVVANMKAAGAILLAISVLPNGGMSTACDDSVYGVAKNPHDSRRTPGGSSCGEGALISSAASLCGIGNDICGSVRVPAYANGIFGLKPTNYPNHVIDSDGIEPQELTTAQPAMRKLTNGPMCRYADDLALAMAVLAGKSVSEYAVDIDFAHNFRLFYVEDLNVLIGQPLQNEQREAVRKVKNHFEYEFNLSVQKVDFPLMSRVYELWGLDGWSLQVPKPMHLSDLASDFFEIYAGESNQTFWSWEFEVLRNFVAPKDEEEKAFVEKKIEKLHRQITELLGRDGVLLLPLWPSTIVYHHQEPFTGVFNNYYIEVPNILGVPSLAAPIGPKSPTTNMPLGVQLIASHDNEALLIAVGREIERAFGGWVTPGKVPKAMVNDAKKWTMH